MTLDAQTRCDSVVLCLDSDESDESVSLSSPPRNELRNLSQKLPADIPQFSNFDGLNDKSAPMNPKRYTQLE